jgi:hypothetical protein
MNINWKRSARLAVLSLESQWYMGRKPAHGVTFIPAASFSELSRR